MAGLESLRGVPGWHPEAELLELAELVLAGALDAAAARFPVPVEVLGDGRSIAIEDAEGTPVALLELLDDGEQRLTPLRPFTAGPLRSARRSPAELRSQLGPTPLGMAPLAVLVLGALSIEQVDGVLARAATSGRPLLWLAVFGSGRPAQLPATGLWRAVRALAEQALVAGLDSIAVPVAVPVGADPIAVAHGYGAAEVVDLDLATADPARPHPAFALELDRAMPPPDRRGVTIFFTGLSGSGKSTVAKALAERLDQAGERTVSLLDGDEVRRLLSAGLSFSRADRDLNIRRIGYVATEVSRHGGIAICAPIAPFDQARRLVRADVEQVGDFVLIHVSTSLAECERRDRKGLYAKARQGLIPDFTGISSPYEVPADAVLRLDTERLAVGEAVQLLWQLLADRGYLAKS